MQFMFRRLYERHKIFCWTAIGLVLLYTVTGFVAVPLIIDHTLRNKVSQLLHRKVRVDSVRTNPYTFSIRLKGLSVSNGERERLLHVGNLYANADPLVSLFKWGVVIKSVEIDRPEVHISRFSDGRFNFKDMISSPNKDTRPTQAKPAQPLRWVLQHLEMTDGVFHYKDEGQPQPFESTLSALDVRIDRLDTQPEAKAAEFRIAARSEADESVEITGGVDVDPLDVSAKIRLKGLLIGKYAPYYRSHLNGKVTDGRLGIQAIISWSDKARAIDKIGLKISGFALVSSQENRLLAVPQFRATGAAIDLNRRTVQLGRVTTRNGQIDVAFDRQGQLNFMQVLAPPSSPDETAAPSRDAAARAQTPMWTVNVPTLVVDNYTVRYRDQQTDPVADMTAHRIHIDAKTLSNQKDAKGTVAVNLNWADQGTLSLEGMVGLVPLQADMTLDARELDVRPLQPYINQHLQLLVTKGLLGSEGRLKLMTRPADGLDIQYTGQVAMNQFKSVDKVKAADFLDWKSLYLKGVAFDSKPFKLMVDEVALTDFYSLFIINADGSSNLAIVTGGDGKAATQKNGGSKISSKAEKPKAESGESNIKIKTVTLQGGKVDFSDLSVKPHVRLPMSQIGGRVSGLDTIRTHKADVLLKGMVGEKVPMEIKGAINPLIKDPFVDITIALNGVDLSPFTPYSGKYLGYKLEKGQLSLDLAYRVVDNKLAGKNKVLFKQLTLGETVQSPTATKLPIKLALALLKDRKGNIDLNLPVTGDLDDPEFSIGGIVIKMFVNLIVDVVSSPFKVLGGLFGGGEELAYLDFDPGQSRIPEANLNKLDTLAKILYERPGLNLEIQGEISPTEDIEGLRRLRFDAQLKAAKLKKMAARGKKAVPLEQIDLSPEERVKLVKKAYDAAKFPKPRDEKGALKKIGPEEMEKLLYTAIEITDDDLRLLAHQRAAAAKSYLAEHGKVEAGRLFIVEPKIDGGEAEQRSRVKFNFT